MKLKNDRLNELAKRYYPQGHPNDVQIAQLQTRLEEPVALFSDENGGDAEKALEQAVTCIEAGISSKKAGGISELRELHYKWINEVCLNKVPGCSTVSASEVHGYAKSKYGYDAIDAKGIGDSMGRGCGKGLFLEPLNAPGRKKLYRVPDPEKYADWYQSHDAVLPRNYYSESYWQKLLVLESANRKSKFFAQRVSSNNN